MENIKSSINAIKYLKNKISLISIINQKETSFSYTNNKVFIKNENSAYYLNEYEFIDLFMNNTFFIKNEDENEIDLSRDDEYYSINKLKK